jgi:hypothetical protein
MITSTYNPCIETNDTAFTEYASYCNEDYYTAQVKLYDTTSSKLSKINEYMALQTDILQKLTRLLIEKPRYMNNKTKLYHYLTYRKDIIPECVVFSVKALMVERAINRVKNFYATDEHTYRHYPKIDTKTLYLNHKHIKLKSKEDVAPREYFAQQFDKWLTIESHDNLEDMYLGIYNNEHLINLHNNFSFTGTIIITKNEADEYYIHFRYKNKINRYPKMPKTKDVAKLSFTKIGLDIAYSKERAKNTELLEQSLTKAERKKCQKKIQNSIKADCHRIANTIVKEAIKKGGITDTTYSRHLYPWFQSYLMKQQIKSRCIDYIFQLVVRKLRKYCVPHEFSVMNVYSDATRIKLPLSHVATLKNWYWREYLDPNGQFISHIYRSDNVVSL